MLDLFLLALVIAATVDHILGHLRLLQDSAKTKGKLSVGHESLLQ